MNALRVAILSIIVVLFGAIFAAWQWRASGHDIVGVPHVESKWDDWEDSGQKREAKPVQKAEQPKVPKVQPQPEPQPEPQVSEEVPAPVIPRSYKQAIDLAKSTKKPLFLYFTSDRCDYCTKMKKDTLGDPRVKEALADYVVYSINVDGPESYVAASANIKVVPYYLICTGDRKVLKTGLGYKGPVSFKNWLQ
jgi:hypothetical protein